MTLEGTANLDLAAQRTTLCATLTHLGANKDPRRMLQAVRRIASKLAGTVNMDLAAQKTILCATLTHLSVSKDP